jgi:hypothetical protein
MSFRSDSGADGPGAGRGVGDGSTNQVEDHESDDDNDDWGLVDMHSGKHSDASRARARAGILAGGPRTGGARAGDTSVAVTRAGAVAAARATVVRVGVADGSGSGSVGGRVGGGGVVETVYENEGGNNNNNINTRRAPNFTPEEDAKLMDAKANRNLSMEEVAQRIPGRTAVQCTKRWNHMKK